MTDRGRHATGKHGKDRFKIPRAKRSEWPTDKGTIYFSKTSKPGIIGRLFRKG